MAKTADEIYDRICDMLSYSRTKLLMGEPGMAKEIWVSALNQWYQNRLVLATNTTSYNALIHQFDVTEEGFKSKGVDVTGIHEALEPSYGQDDFVALMAENKRYREALEFYADVGNYESDIVESLPVNDIPIGRCEYIAPEVIEDNGDKAREALEGNTPSENDRLRALLDRVRSEGIPMHRTGSTLMMISYGLWKECGEVGA